MTNDTNGSRPQRGLWNSPVLTALVTGMFGVLTACIGYLAVLRESGDDSGGGQAAVNTSAAPFTPERQAGHPVPSESDSTSVRESQSAPNLLLNFAAFQARMGSPDLKTQERELVTRPLLHRQVVWKGYVEQITPAAEPTADWTVMVSLVESREKASQSMFTMPALCRFGPEAVDQISTLAPGDQVTIIGTFVDHTIIGTRIDDAHLTNINGRSLSRIAGGSATGANPR